MRLDQIVAGWAPLFPVRGWWSPQNSATLSERECDSISDYELTRDQEGRVDQLLAESDSIRHFVAERIEFAKGSDLTAAEILSAYFDYCSDRGWVAFTSKHVERELPDIMLELFRSARNTHVERDGKRQRGYPNVSFITE